MKKLLMAMVLMPFVALADSWADSWTDPDTGIAWKFDSVDGRVYLGSMSSYVRTISTTTKGDVVIPSHIKGMPVVSIGNYAFSGCELITSLVIPEGVEGVLERAFAGCVRLRSVSIPTTLRYIGQIAFAGCDALESVDIRDLASWCKIDRVGGGPHLVADGLFLNGEKVTNLRVPDGVEVIRDHAFAHIAGLKTVIIPSSVTNIGYRAFSCGDLEFVCFEGNAPTNGGLIYGENNDHITITCVREGSTGWGTVSGEWCRCPIETWTDYPDVPWASTVIEVDGVKWQYYAHGGDAIVLRCLDAKGDLVIPESLEGHKVVAIADEAFSDCSLITSVKMPESVVRIGEKAFRNCVALTSVSIPVRVTWIRDETFSGCRGLESVQMAGSVVAVGDFAFCGCRGLKSLTLPESVMSIGCAAFSGCDGLTSIGIPESVMSIGDEAFYNCKELATVIMHSKVRSIGDWAFGMSKISEVYVDDLSSFGQIDFGNMYSNPLWAEARLYANGIVVEDTVKVTFKLGDDYNWIAVIPDENSEWGFVSEKTIEVGIGRPVWPPEVSMFDERFEIDSWDANIRCAMSDVEVHPIYRGAEINAVLNWQPVDAQCCMVDHIVYDTSSECIRAQGMFDTGYSPLSYLDDTYQYGALDERLYENLRIRLIGRDEQGGRVCHADLSRSYPISGDGFTWSGTLPIDTNIIRQIDVALASTWYEGEYVLYQIQISDIDCRKLVVRKLDVWDLFNADYRFVSAERPYSESRWKYYNYRRELEGEECEAVYEFSDREGLFSTSTSVLLNGMGVDLSGGAFTWMTAYDSNTYVTNMVDLYQFRTSEQGQERHAYSTVISIPPQRYFVRFDLDDCGTRVGGGELIQEIDLGKGEREEMPIVEAKPYCTFLRWTPSHWGNGVLVYIAEYDREYVITYKDAMGQENPNPTTYTVTNEIVFAALADTDEYWFKGWEPAKIEVGTTGDLVVTAKWDRIQSVAETAGDQNREWVSSGDADWFVTWNDEKGKYVVRSCEIGDGQVSTLETVVTNGGTVSFDVKVSCEGMQRGQRTDGLSILVDGEEKLWLDGEVGWTNVTIAVAGEGGRSIKWKYSKDVESAAGDDCAYLANFKFYHQVVVSFDGGGATMGDVPPAIVSYNGGMIVLPEIGTLKKDKHSFAGWSDGAVLHQPGEQYMLGDVPPTFTAVWCRKELQSPVITVSPYYETERTTVAITAGEGATIRYTVDGSDPLENGLVYRGPFEVAGSLTVRAVAVRDDWFDSAVVEASTVRAPWGYAECLNSEDVGFMSGGGSAWVRDLLVSHDGTASVRSGKIGNNETNWLEATVIGAGTLSFWWKASAEMWRQQFVDCGTLWIDGVEQLGVRIGNHDDWRQELIAIKGGTRHTIRWLYSKDVEDAVPFEWEDCIWLDEVMWHPVLPSVADDAGATLTGDAETGFVIKPSDGKTVVEVTIPQGVDAAKVTVEVSVKVATVKPNGAKVKIVSGGADITEFLNVPTADGNGVVDLTKATVKEEIVKEAMDPAKGAEIKLNSANPSLTTPNTRVGLFYQLREGETLDGMVDGDSTIGDGEPWTPEIKVKGGNSAFYSIGVGKGE